MRIGFIGAGKAGSSLSRYFASDKHTISGFYSKTYEHSKQAADYVKSAAFLSLEEVIRNSDIIFITTPDGIIRQVWKDIKQLKIDLTGKIFCHCSGSLSSLIFDGIKELGAHGCAVHPMQAISSKNTDLHKTFFTLDGSPDGLSAVTNIIERKSGRFAVINPASKSKYHAAASTASNLMVGLAEMALDLLEECGFDRKDALQMLTPLMRGNMESVCSCGPVSALTGPVERCDCSTVEAHLSALTGNEREIYRLISCKLVNIAQEKNTTRDYSGLRKKLEE